MNHSCSPIRNFPSASPQEVLMASVTKRGSRRARRTTARLLQLPLAVGLCVAAACGPSTTTSSLSPTARPDPRVGLKAGLTDAAEAASNVRVVATVEPPEGFKGVTNSDLAFTSHYAIQGNYNGFQIWDISNPAKPVLTKAVLCPASQSDVSAYKNLLFVSAEGMSGRTDCGTEGVRDSVSAVRMRGIRIFDITDISNPKYITNVQTCRGSHTHTVVTDPKDKENVYIYVSGSAGVRSPSELAGCSRLSPDKDPNSALFRIEVIKVPLAHPEQAAIVSSPRIFNELVAPPRHGEAPEDIAAAAKAAAEHRAKGGYTAKINGSDVILPPQFINPRLDSIVKARGGSGAPTAADSATLRTSIQGLVDQIVGARDAGPGPRPGPTQCHDITVYPSLGLAGGACEGYGLLLDISDVTNPRRIDAVSDSNFAYWHSATFNNDGSKLLFSDEWGGGGGPKCRASDKPQWGANAIFTRTGNKMEFKSYYKMPAAQTVNENCVAHNGSLIPVPGRDIMVQAWYQGGISVFDWTDAANPKEIAFFDRGPIDSTKLASGGAWSTYWYNGNIYSSEIARGMDVFELTPSAHLTKNEIDAAKSVKLEYFNAQEQPKVTWPPTFALSRAYLDQLERNKGLPSDKIAAARRALDNAEKMQQPSERYAALNQLATQLTSDAATATDQAKVQTLGTSVRALANAQGLVAQPSN